jgi:hypothetical protein
MNKLKIIGRIASWLFLALAVVAAGAEAVGSLQAGEWQPMAMGQVWYDLDRGSINLMQAVTQRYLHPAIWDPVVIEVLQWPAWFVALIPATILFLICRPARRKRWFS